MLTAAQQRVKWTFDNFPRIYCSFSAGKDSGVMAHLVLTEARKRNRKVGLFFLDWEAQFTHTIDFARAMYTEYVPAFGKWYANGERTAAFVGIRAQESLNRFRTLARDKPTFDGRMYTTNVVDDVWNVYPIYDWQTEDIWTFHGKTGKAYNKLYDRMHQAGMTLHQMRICEPFGEESRKGMWLYQVIEPTVWAKLVLRANGANTGKLYANVRGSMMGNHTIKLPLGHTWKSFALSILDSTPPKTREHYKNKIAYYIQWYKVRGYPGGLPDGEEVPIKLENARKVPSWRRVCKTLLKNDYWCKYLDFSPTKTSAYSRYEALMAKRRNAWGIFGTQVDQGRLPVVQ